MYKTLFGGIFIITFAAVRDYTRDVGTTTLNEHGEWCAFPVMDLRTRVYTHTLTHDAIYADRYNCVETKRIAELAEQTSPETMAVLYFPLLRLTRRALLRHGHVWTWAKAWGSDHLLYLGVVTYMII